MTIKATKEQSEKALKVLKGLSNEMTKDEARQTLRDFGYSTTLILKIEDGAKNPQMATVS